ncbi:MAG: glycosyltransferase, partial [Deltaproteobacteria bacterium]|nr:glycosyltransferase [Deltaproteobacteria bacterium]
VLNQAAHISTITPFHRERLLRAGLPSAQVTLLPCAVAVPADVAALPTSASLRVLTVGRLVPKKGHDLLIDACAALAGKGRSVELVIVGEGEQGLALRQLAARHMTETGGRFKVEFRGETPAEVVRSLMLHGGFHAFALACRIAPDGDRDGLPVALLEAQACGLPTVTTSLPGFESQLQDDRDGLLLPVAPDRRRVSDGPGPERASLAAALACLQDVPVLRARLAAGARQQAELRPTPAAVGRRLMEMLGRLLPGAVYDARPLEGR